MNQSKHFSITAVIIHWVLAVSTIFLFVSSWWMLALPYNEYRYFPFQLHKNIGISLFFLLIVLLFIRLRKPPAQISSPKFTPAMHKLAIAGHVATYLLIFAVCISGYLSSSYSGWGTTLWWLVELPEWGYENEELNEFYSEVHLWTCWALLAVIVLHVSAAVYHAFRRDGVTDRMLHMKIRDN
ncbi:MAG: cytochrome b/b6 domain-containing protein [Gammaproteobacteria bacterium]|nr:cytochrome b/b6 domain-containing protein [Gammaproteobacteria bacterium]